VDGTAAEGFMIGFRGVTTVPFDGTPSALLVRPEDVGADGLRLGYETIEGFHPESDGSVTAVYCTVVGPVCGVLSAQGAWTELGRTYDECWPTTVLSDEQAVYFATRTSLWRVDRQSHEARVLYYLPDNGGLIYRYAQTRDSIAMVLPTYTDGAEVGVELAQIAKAGGPVVTLRTIGDLNTPAITGMVADDQAIYILTSQELDRVSLAGGSMETLAKRGESGGRPDGAFVFPVLGAARVYFLDGDLDWAGNPTAFTVRSVEK
jgi:hypothetical protein